MVFTTRCAQCGKILWFSGSLAGKLTICPACGAVMRLMPPPEPQTPGAAAATPVPAPEGPAGTPTAAPVAPGAPETPVVIGEESTTPEISPLSDTPPAAPVPPPPSPFDQIQEEVAERAPEVVEQTYLTHQAAAAVGDVHADVGESDVVQWTAEHAPLAQEPPPVPVAPPVWEPAPLSGSMYPAPPQPPSPAWSEGPAVSRIDSLMRGSPTRTPEEEEMHKRRIAWGVGATVVVAMVLGILWMLRGQAPSMTWEQANRDQILTLKQEAENLALAGKNQEAYNTYQELERLVSGQSITDPFLQEELARSWQRRDAIFNLLAAGSKGGSTTQPVQTGGGQSAGTPTTAPTPEVQSPPTTGPDETLVMPPEPATEPDVTPEPAPPATRPATTRPAVKPDIPPATGITDAQIGSSIERGVDYLLSRFLGNTLNGNFEHYEGLDTLCVYALMQAELATHDKRLDIHGPFMDSAIGAMKKFPMSADYVTYARSLRATALALNDRPQDHWVVRDDVNWLLQSQEHGAFTYNNEFPRGSTFNFWDNSNSQYGLLGVWSGAEVGVQVPIDFWRDVRSHWGKYQLNDGEWGYRADDQYPSRSMTLAGIASLFVAQDYLDASDYGEQVGRPPFQPALQKALDWLEHGDNSVLSVQAGDFYSFYAMYGLERTGLASGFKYYGSHDWYRERAADLVAAQKPDGSWGNPSAGFDELVNTSFAMLFLARGRHPILMNKLRYDGHWANRPRDAANLARFASSELERPLNWQVTPLDHDWTDWTDSQILYMAGDEPVKLEDGDKEKFRQFIENGGMLLTQADGGSPRFSQFVEKLGSELFPQYPWVDLPADSPVWSVSYHIEDKPKIRAIMNGSRVLMLHFPEDLTKYWQLRQEKNKRSEFELGVNLALYSAGKSELKNRLSSDPIAMPDDKPAGVLSLARVKYEGNWNPEPAAWPRARRWFRQQTSLDIDIEPTGIEALGDSKAPIAHLTGTGKVQWTPAAMDSVKKYVEAGGVLVIEPCGSPDEFLQSVHDDLLLKAFPSARIETMGRNSPMMTASANGMTDVSQPEVRQFVRSYTDITEWRPTLMRAGQGLIVILPLDMTSGLLGEDAWGIVGYQPEYALALMKNMVLWAWDGSPD